VELKNIYRIFLPTVSEYIFSAAHGTPSKLDHI
jgi:hypothetical protein